METITENTRAWQREIFPPYNKYNKRKVLPENWRGLTHEGPSNWISDLSRKFFSGWRWEDHLLKTPQLEYSEIENAIKDSKKLLELKFDFDGEGSPGYSIGTWKRSVGFLRKYASLYVQTIGTCLVAPKILPGPDGSIDILWKTAGCELLVNIPSDSKKPASFYGDKEDGTFIKGSLDPKTFNQGLLEWLIIRK